MLKKQPAHRGRQAGMGRGALFFRVGEKRWVMEWRQWSSVLRSHLGHPTQLGPPYSSLSIPIPAPAQDPLLKEPPNSPLSLPCNPHPSPPLQAQASPNSVPLPPASSHCRHPALGTSFQGTHSASTPHPPGVPSSQRATQEKNAEGGCLAIGSRQRRQLGLAGGKESHNQAENPVTFFP